MSKKVKFPLVKDGNRIVYPDDMSLFSDTDLIGETMYAVYSGDLALEEVARLPSEAGKRYSRLEFVASIPPGKYRQIVNAADTDDLIFQFLDMVKMADYIDTKDEKTIAGLGYLLAQGIINQSLHDDLLG